MTIIIMVNSRLYLCVQVVTESAIVCNYRAVHIRKVEQILGLSKLIEERITTFLTMHLIFFLSWFLLVKFYVGIYVQVLEVLNAPHTEAWSVCLFSCCCELDTSSDHSLREGLQNKHRVWFLQRMNWFTLHNSWTFLLHISTINA
jgi:hypothetical protein